MVKEALLTRYGDKKLCLKKMFKDLVNDIKGLHALHNKINWVIYKTKEVLVQYYVL